MIKLEEYQVKSDYIKLLFKDNNIGMKFTNRKFNLVLMEFLKDNNIKYYKWIQACKDEITPDLLNSYIVCENLELFKEWVEKNKKLIKLLGL